MIQVLDTNATLTSEIDSNNNRQSQRAIRHFVIDTETIIRGSNLREEELIDEALKARFLARLFREYRRNLEYAKRMHEKSNRLREEEGERNQYILEEDESILNERS